MDLSNSSVLAPDHNFHILTIDFMYYAAALFKESGLSSKNIEGNDMDNEADDMTDINNESIIESNAQREETMRNVNISCYNKDAFLQEVYLSEEKYDQLNHLLKRNKNIILQGAPGVGKTYAAKRLAYAMMGQKDDSRIEFIQFHQNYSYEDFVMGYKPDGNGFTLIDGIFYEFCNKARKDSSRDYFFIIDEINRGNLSKFFGELLMMIECEHRGEEVTLSYKKERFSVPQTDRGMDYLLWGRRPHTPAKGQALWNPSL